MSGFNKNCFLRVFLVASLVSQSSFASENASQQSQSQPEVQGLQEVRLMAKTAAVGVAAIGSGIILLLNKYKQKKAKEDKSRGAYIRSQLSLRNAAIVLVAGLTATLSWGLWDLPKAFERENYYNERRKLLDQYAYVNDAGKVTTGDPVGYENSLAKAFDILG